MDNDLSLGAQLGWLLMLAIPVACIAWTVTHEEVFREPREFFVERSRTNRNLGLRKFFYLFTCEYCFSHWVALAFVLVTGFKLLLDDWRGVVIALFALVWVANIYMSLYGRLRLDIKHERLQIDKDETAGDDSHPDPASASKTDGATSKATARHRA